MRRLLYVNSALVLVIGIPLYLFSEQTNTYFAWTIHPPLTAAVLGAGYWASFVLELLSARERLWAKTRVAVPAVLLFSTLTLAITLIHADRFHFHSPHLITRAGTWMWLGIYVSVPVAMSWLLVAQQRQARPDPARVAPLASWARVVLALQAAVMLVVGVPMLLVPQAMLRAWPWELTPLTSRAIGAWAIGSDRDHRRPCRVGDRLVATAAHDAELHPAGPAADHQRAALPNRLRLEPPGRRGLCALPRHHPPAGRLRLVEDAARTQATS